MRNALRVLLAFLLLLVLMLGVCSIRRWQNSCNLLAAGVETTAQIVEKQSSMIADGYPSQVYHKAYSITLCFKDWAGRENELRLNTDNQALADTLQPGGFAPIKYLPSDPTVFHIVGPLGEREFEFGLGVLIFGGVSAAIGVVIVALKLRFG